MKSDYEKLIEFIEMRKEIIDRLDSGEMSKEYFLLENYNLIDRLSMRPYLKIDSFEQGIYNYQYYNILAKYYNNEANKYKFNKKQQHKYKLAIGKCRNYYNEKDVTTKRIIDILNYENMEAYYIDMQSDRLKGKLYEIYIKNYEKAILHSMDDDIKRLLVENNVFSDDIRKSVIDNYVNKGY